MTVLLAMVFAAALSAGNAEFEAAGLGDIIAAKQAQLDAYLGK